MIVIKYKIYIFRNTIMELCMPNIVGSSAANAVDECCGWTPAHNQTGKNPEKCFLPVPMEVLESHSCKTPQVFWDTAFNNTPAQQAFFTTLNDAIALSWRREVRRTNWIPMPDYAECIKNTLHTNEVSLLDFAKLCAGCPCCYRHGQGTFLDGVTEPGPSVEEDPDDEWGYTCTCRCRNLLRWVNDIFKEEPTRLAIPTMIALDRLGLDREVAEQVARELKMYPDQ